jgi:hypothetical protein
MEFQPTCSIETRRDATGYASTNEIKEVLRAGSTAQVCIRSRSRKQFGSGNSWSGRLGYTWNFSPHAPSKPDETPQATPPLMRSALLPMPQPTRPRITKNGFGPELGMRQSGGSQKEVLRAGSTAQVCIRSRSRKQFGSGALLPMPQPTRPRITRPKLFSASASDANLSRTSSSNL